jgi:hypothetical protein
METKLQVRAAFNYEKSSEYPVSPVSLLSISTPSPTVPKRNMSFGYVAPSAPKRHISLTIETSNLDAKLSDSSKVYSFPSVTPRNDNDFPKQSDTKILLSPMVLMRSANVIPLILKDSIFSDTASTSNLDAKLYDSTVYSFPPVQLRKESWIPSINDFLGSNQSDATIPLARISSANVIPLNRKDSISSETSSSGNLNPSAPLRKESWVPSINDLSTIHQVPMSSANVTLLEQKDPSSSETSSTSNLDAKLSDYTVYNFPSAPLSKESWIPSKEHITFQPPLRSSSHSQS